MADMEYKNGSLHLSQIDVSTKLNLSDNAMTEFQQALKNSGFNPGGAGDWSDYSYAHLPKPKCAIINFSNINSMPTSKTDNLHAYMEFYDMCGNYFKKEVIANAQGRSTMSHPKKNISIDICNNNGWDDDDTFNLQIGDWVPQDSFHIKAYYNDPFRGLCAITYNLYDEIVKTRGELKDYIWKRALLNDNITDTSTGYEDYEDAIDLWNTGAKCFPQGFPCIIYLNGDFYGIFSFQLKKHRDNYAMSKKKPKHIHLDGIISLDRILMANGDSSKIWWTSNSPEGVEIRNPKPKKKKDGWDLILIDGTTYDADENGGEIIGVGDKVRKITIGNIPSGFSGCTIDVSVGEYIFNIQADPSDTIASIRSKILGVDYSSAEGYSCTATPYNNKSIWFKYIINGNMQIPDVSISSTDNIITFESEDFSYDSSNESCVKSGQTKQCILNLTKILTELNEAYIVYQESEKTTEDKETFKNIFETYFDIENLIDYLIISDVVANYDGFSQNVQWITYNGIKWYLSIYDVDGVMGNWWKLEDYFVSPQTSHYTYAMFQYIPIFYNGELESRYKDLRDSKIIDKDHICNLVIDWMNQIGNKETFDKEWSKWPGFIKNDNIHRLYKWIEKSINNMDSLVYHYNN